MIKIIFRIKISFYLYFVEPRRRMLSNSTKYAIKAVLYLALYSNENQKIMAKDISQSIAVPQAYLSKLLQELSRHNIVSSTKGPRGGFFLNEENRNNPLIKIVNVIEGHQKIQSCLLSLENCNEKRPCPLHELVAPSKKKLLKSLQGKTIAQISGDIDKGITFFPL
ncbi:MAG: Rrf2 family transcriptional regulator [Maribacter sp.]|nr:Rrf2 family transcriptional regulator [Maribacter sp.]